MWCSIELRDRWGVFSFLVTEALLIACFPLPCSGAHQHHDQSYPRRSPRRQQHTVSVGCVGRLSPRSLPSSCTSAKRPAESAACSQMATSLLSLPNLSVAEVSAQCVFLAVESCRVHGKRFDDNIAPSRRPSAVHRQADQRYRRHAPRQQHHHCRR